MNQEQSSDSDGRVVPLRRRQPNATRAGPPRPAPPDLSRYERGAGDDDYRHRMAVNVAALVFTAVLVVGGVWVANTIADMRKNQDCVLSGKRNCGPLPIPAADR